MNPWADELATAEEARTEGRYEDARQRLVRLHGRVRRAGQEGHAQDPANAARLRLCLAKCCWSLGRTEDAGVEARAALGLYSGPQPALASTLYERRSGAAEAEMLLTELALHGGEWERAEAHLERASAILAEINERSLEASFALLRGRMSLESGEDLEAEEHFAAGLAEARRARYAAGECAAWTQLAGFYRVRGDMDAAESALGRAYAVAGASPAPDLCLILAETQGQLRLSRARLPEALEAFERGLDVARSCGDRRGEGRLSIRMGEALCISGEVRTRTFLTAGIGLLAECRDKRGLAEGFMAVARLQADSRNPLAAMLSAEISRRLLAETRATRLVGETLGAVARSLSDLGAYREAFIAAHAHEAVAGHCHPSAREVARRFRRHALPGWKDLMRPRPAAWWVDQTQRAVERMFSTLNAEVPFPSLSSIPGALSSMRLVWAIRSDVVDSGMAPWSRAEFAGDTDDTALEQG